MEFSQSPEFEGSKLWSPNRILGKSAMAEKVRGHGWAGTALGALQTWPAERTSVVNLTLAAPFPSVLLWGPEFLMLFNDAFSVASGIGDEWLGKPCREGWPETWQILNGEIVRAFETGTSSLREDICLRNRADQTWKDRDGRSGDSFAFITCSFTPVYEGSAIAGLSVAMRDTTQAVATTRRLRDSEERSAQILQSIGDGVVVTDAAGRVRRMNAVAEKLTGWTLDDANARPLHEIFHIVNEESRRIVESPAETVLRSGEALRLANHTVLIRPDKVETHIDDSAAPIRDESGELSGVVLVFRDIEARRHAEIERERLLTELGRKYDEMRAIYETSSVALAMIDPVTFCYVRGNPKLAETIGAPVDGIAGRRVFEVANDVAGLHEALQQAASGIPVLGKVIEGELTNDPGIFRTWQSDYIPVFSGGKVEVIVASSVEITPVKQMQAAFMQAEKLAVVGRLAASIAHEINNPLESVMNLLFLSSSSRNLEEVHGYLKIAEHELRRVAGITNQTLRFHKQAAHPTAATCDELLEGVLVVYRSRLMNTKIEVQKRERANRPVLCFEGEIRQVLNNLIGNAIDAMTPKGGRLLLRSREATHWKTGNRGLVITVADTNGGIPPEVLSRIFEPFFTTKGQYGTGLGLWVSHEIVERHKGTLRVRSSQRPSCSGTVFTLFLPFDAVDRRGSQR